MKTRFIRSLWFAARSNSFLALRSAVFLSADFCSPVYVGKQVAVANPAVAGLIKIDNQLHNIGAEFGFGASNRVRLKAHPDLQKIDPFLDFLEQQKAISNQV